VRQGKRGVARKIFTSLRLSIVFLSLIIILFWMEINVLLMSNGDLYQWVIEITINKMQRDGLAEHLRHSTEKIG